MRSVSSASLVKMLARWISPAAAAAVARYLVAMMQGISVHARDGATPSELESIADHAMAALPPL